MKKFISAALAIAALVSCTDNDKKTLVLYYSQSGSTATVAEEFAAQLGADIARYDVVNPYDGTYAETIQRCGEERASGNYPAVDPTNIPDLAQYDVIFLGYPIWYGSCALPVYSLLEVADLDGKTIVPFCTFGSGGIESSTAELVEKLPNSTVKAGYGVRTARVEKAPKEIELFLIENGYKEGNVEALPSFSEPENVNEEQAAIFDEACSSYQMPLGTPAMVGSRQTPDGTEYRFVAESNGPEGTSQSIIYVIKPAEGAAEFTKVVR